MFKPHIAIFFVFVVASSAGAAVQTQAPSRTIAHVRGDVYTATEDGRTTIFVVTNDGVVVVDPLNGSFGRWLAGELKTQFPDRPIKYVVYSRFDFDRIGGAGVLAARAEIIAHRAITTRLSEGVRRTLPRRYAAFDFNQNGILEQDEVDAAEEPDLMSRLDRNRDGHISGEESWSETPFPSRTFTTRYTIESGGTNVELLYVGPERTGATAIYVPEDRLMFVAELPLSDPFADSSLRLTEATAWIHTLLERDFDTVLTRSGTVVSRAQIIAEDEYVRTMVAAVVDGIEHGRTVQQLQRDTNISGFVGTPYGGRRNADIAALYKRTVPLAFDVYGTALANYISTKSSGCPQDFTCGYGRRTGTGGGGGFGLSMGRWRIALEMTSGTQFTSTSVSRYSGVRENSRESHVSILGGYRSAPVGRFNIALVGGLTFISATRAMNTAYTSTSTTRNFKTDVTGWTIGADIAAPISRRVGLVFPMRATTSPPGLPRSGVDLRAGVGMTVAVVRRVL